MNLRKLAQPAEVTGKLREIYWQAFPGGSVDPVTLTWPVDREALRSVRVRWPSTYQWRPRKIKGDQVLGALRRFVPVDVVDIFQPFQGVINFEVEINGRTFPVNMETSDYPELNEDAYDHAALTFKQAYRLSGYGDRERLLPGGYVNADRVIYRYLPRLRRMRDASPPSFEVYGRYGLSMDKRRTPMTILTNSAAFRYHGGEGKVRYSTFLEECARSKICVDLPSMSSITFRMMDLCAIGSCIVGPPHTDQLQEPFVNGVHVAYCRPDYADLEAVCVHYLEHEDERLALVENSRRFFDAYIHRDQLGSYMLYHCLERLN